MSGSGRPSHEDIEVFQQLIVEFARTNPVLREAMSRSGSGGVGGLGVPSSEWPAMLAALRALPDDAGQPAIDHALARWYGPGEQGV
jgi:hypothetical protein